MIENESSETTKEETEATTAPAKPKPKPKPKAGAGLSEETRAELEQHAKDVAARNEQAEAKGV